MLAEEIQAAIASAEQKVKAKVFDEDQSSLSEVLKVLNDTASASDTFPPAVLLRLATVLRELGQGFGSGAKEKLLLQQAQQVLDKGLDWHKADLDLINEQGNLSYYNGHYDRASECFERVIKKLTPANNPKRIAALENAGAALRELRKFTEADAMLGQAMELAPAPSARLFIERGWLRFYKGSYARAFGDFAGAHHHSTATDDERDEAMSGQIASRQAEDALNPAAGQDRAAEIMRGANLGESFKPRALKVLSVAGSSHITLNLFPAALMNYELMLSLDSRSQEAWYSKIMALRWLRRFTEAEKFYQSAQAKFPSCVEIWKEMAHLHYHQKRFQEAYSYYTGQAVEQSVNSAQNNATFLEALKRDPDANEYAIVSLRKMRSFDKARKEVDELLAEDRDNVLFLGEKAVIEFTEREYERAIVTFKRVLAIDAYNEFAWQWLAAAYRKQQEFEKAKSTLQDGLAKIPFATGLWEERAWLAFDQGDWKLAGEYFDKAIEMDPYLINRRFSRIQVYLRSNQWDEALQVFEKLEKDFPQDPEVAEQRCWFHLRRGEMEQARAQWETIAATHPGHVLGINARGGYELEQRNYVAAEAAFRQAIAQVDYEPQYHINLAWALLRQAKEPGEFPISALPRRTKLLNEAKQSCRQALRLDPFNSKAYGCLGVIAFKLNAFLDAEAYFLKSITLNPPEGSYVELAALYCQMGRYDDAAKHLHKALELDRGDARAYIELGNVSVLKENNTEAIRQCCEAVVVEANNPEAHRALAIALMRADKWDEAESSVRRALTVVAPAKRWQLYLLLSQILIHLGDVDNKGRNKKDFGLYSDALESVNNAKRSYRLPHADISFHAAVAHYRLEDYYASQESFTDCSNENRDRYEAQRYSRIALAQQKKLFRINAIYGWGLAGICIVILLGMWVTYYAGFKRTILVAPTPSANTAEAAGKREPKEEFMVDQALLNVMTPILLGLIVIAALLPNLNKLKLPGGIEAEISEPKPIDPNISSGPRGDIGFGSSLPIVNPEPR